MGIFNWFTDLFTNDHAPTSPPDITSTEAGTINPASGLPMVGGTGGIDVAGNPYGFADNPIDSGSATGLDDDWSAGTGIDFSDSDWDS